MKLIDKRREIISNEFFTLELERRQLLTIMSALGLTNKHERASELNNFYGVLDDFDDNGDKLFDELTEMLGMEDKFDEPAQNKHPYASYVPEGATLLANENKPL